MLELVYSNNATFLREKNIAGTTVVHFPNKLFRHKKKPFAKKYIWLCLHFTAQWRGADETRRRVGLRDRRGESGSRPRSQAARLALDVALASSADVLLYSTT